jgi:hypothetical protein
MREVRPGFSGCLMGMPRTVEQFSRSVHGPDASAQVKSTTRARQNASEDIYARDTANTYIIIKGDAGLSMLHVAAFLSGNSCGMRRAIARQQVSI